MTVTDELYTAIAGNLWWEIEGVGWRTFSETSPLETDKGSIYTNLKGTLRMTWEWFTDESGKLIPRLIDISGSEVELITSQDQGPISNNFKFKRLREIILECYGR